MDPAIRMNAKNCDPAKKALARLQEGNEAYCSDERNPAALTERLRLKTASEGQRPYAAVVSCADSRVPPEHIFSAGLGELFVIRNAGNVISPSVLASVEYAVEHLHVPLVLVMGHRGCGAVAAAVTGHGEPGALGELVAQVRANIGAAANAAEAELANVKSAMNTLRNDELLQKALSEGKTALCGAIYDIRTGKVELLPDR